MSETVNLEYYKQRIFELEQKVEQLRFSRRVLMNLIEKIEKEKSYLISRLEKENKRLYKDKCRYVQTLMKKNRKIKDLESKLSYHIKGSAN